MPSTGAFGVYLSLNPGVRDGKMDTHSWSLLREGHSEDHFSSWNLGLPLRYP